jgi:Flp pilus assembly protein TadB
MRSALWQFVRPFLAAVLIAAFAVSQPVPAQASTHLVSPADLQTAAVDASQSRQQNIDTLNRFLSSDQALKAMRSAHVNPREVNKAVSSLSDEELAQLASRAQKAQSDFAAGNIDNRDLLIIILCIVALILIVIAVH